jgi:hypothetical protein
MATEFVSAEQVRREAEQADRKTQTAAVKIVSRANSLSTASQIIMLALFILLILWGVR